MSWASQVEDENKKRSRTGSLCNVLISSNTATTKQHGRHFINKYCTLIIFNFQILILTNSNVYTL